jgi:hypothetical protein
MSDGNRIHSPALQIPRQIRIDGEFLCWEDVSLGDIGGEEPETRRPTDRMLLAFARLENAIPEEISAFAARYGALRVFEVKPGLMTENDLIVQPYGPIWHQPAWGSMPSRRESEGKEPLALWRLLAARVRAILRINAALQGRARQPNPMVGTEADWDVIIKSFDPIVQACFEVYTDGRPRPEDVIEAQFRLMLELQMWLRVGRVGLGLGITQLSRSRTSWKLQVTYVGLLGALAYQLLLNVIGESSLYACDGCGIPYIRLKRAPRPGQENFCDDCSEVPKRRAVQRYRQRRSAK